MRELCLVLLLLPGILALPEQGAFIVNMTQDTNIAVFTKSMYKNTSIAVKINCLQDQPAQVEITWLLRWTPCAQEYVSIDYQKELANMFLQDPTIKGADMPYTMVKYKKKVSRPQTCAPGGFITVEEDFEPFTFVNGTILPVVSQKRSQEGVSKASEQESANKKTQSRKKRQTGENPAAQADAAAKSTQKPTKGATTAATPMFMSTTPDLMFDGGMGFPDKDKAHQFHTITNTWEDGIYLFIIEIQAAQGSSYEATVDVRMKGPRGGFLSAIEWPLLPFYGVMCFVYVVFGLIWLVLSFCNWRDLLRIQFWIGGVIFLGMLEKAVFFAEFESINATGQSVRGAILFGELVSCLKRTLARMLVIIVSLGFGIVKPRLGPTLHKVLALGAVYFILSAVEGCMRDLKSKTDMSNQATLAAIPLAVIDAAICWWIFTGLVSTIRTLRLRRNLVKLSLYRHFTNTLIFSVVASVAFMVWSITQHKFSKCLSDWKELWVDEAFWHMLFSVILMVIMALWRPSANNQRYAFSALMDLADEEAEEPMIIEALDGMKMRGVKGPPSNKEKSKVDEDLKWIDDNIPSSVADTALPSLLDSDEEVMNTKYEMSKME